MTERFEKTYNEHQSKLKAYIDQKVAHRETAEDILQDVFLTALKNANVLEPIENLAGWLFTVAKNKITDWYRSKKDIPIDPDDEITAGELLSEFHITSPDSYSSDFLMESIWAAIDSLPHEQKMVFLLNAVEEVPFRDIADLEGIPMNTLIARKRYAVQNLRKKLQHLTNEINS